MIGMSMAARSVRPIRDDCRRRQDAPEYIARTGFVPTVDDPSGDDSPFEEDPETEG